MGIVDEGESLVSEEDTFQVRRIETQLYITFRFRRGDEDVIETIHEVALSGHAAALVAYERREGALRLSEGHIDDGGHGSGDVTTGGNGPFRINHITWIYERVAFAGEQRESADEQKAYPKSFYL